MVSRGRTTATAGTTATRSPTTTTAATRTATTKAAPAKAATTSKPTTTRKTITQSAQGQAVQAQFKQAVSSAVESVGIDFGVPTVKTTVQETPTEIITITEKPEVIEEQIIEEQIIEEQIIEEPIIELPELIPEVFAEEQIILADDIIQILNDIENGVILVPTWFRNNIEWVKNGHITQQEFRTAYNYLVDTQVVHPPEQDLTINDNMVTQQVINFNIINGRAVGSIKFQATNNFNPYYYGKNIVNIIQIKDPNGVNILTTVKQNTLNFTETERDEVISYDEDVKQNTRATVESFVWSSATTPTAFSKMFTIDISETEPPKPIQVGLAGAGVALSVIAGAIVFGFIADHKRGK
jgi:hypothetical protein